MSRRELLSKLIDLIDADAWLLERLAKLVLDGDFDHAKALAAEILQASKKEVQND